MQQTPRMHQPAHPQGQFMVHQPPPQPQAATAAVNNAAAMAVHLITGVQPTDGPQCVAAMPLAAAGQVPIAAHPMQPTSATTMRARHVRPSSRFAPSTRNPPMPVFAMPAAATIQFPIAARLMQPTPATVMRARHVRPSFRLASSTRNPPMPVSEPSAMQVPQPAAAVMIQDQDPLTASMLVNATSQEQKQMLGERLNLLIDDIVHYPDLAGKITSMLLGKDNAELLYMLESTDFLRQKVEEAFTVLQAYPAKQAAGGKGAKE